MSNINFEEDRVDSVTQIDQTKDLSDKVIELRNLEDQIKASEDHTKNLKEKAKQQKSKILGQKPVNGRGSKKENTRLYNS